MTRPTLLVATLVGCALLGALATLMVFVDQLSDGTEPGTLGYMLSFPDGWTRGISEVAVFPAIACVSLAGWLFASEYSHATMRNLLVRAPSRSRLVAGKFGAVACFLALAMAVYGVASVAAALGFAAGTDVSTAMWFSPEGVGLLASALGRLAAAAVGCALLGAALGLITRSVAITIGVAIGYLVAVEALVTVGVPALRAWLPGQLLAALSADGMDMDTISAPTAALRFAAFAVVLIPLTLRLFSRRDVTG